MGDLAAPVRYAGGELLAEVVRSGFVEGYHRGSVIVLSAAGEAVAAAGDVTGAIFPRSANKPMQAAGMLRAGLALTEPAQLALASASHYGEPAHVEVVRSMLRGAGALAGRRTHELHGTSRLTEDDGLAEGDGLTEDDLACPPDLPQSEPARAAVLAAGGGPERVYMNCSGKHVAMLLTCLAAGWPTEDYYRPDHPLQKHLAAVLEEIVDEPAGAVGVDGCGAPVLAFSLAGLARAYLRLVESAPGSAERTVVDAVRAYPELVSCTGADDARLMRGVPGILAKGGAEGILAVALPGVGAVVLKIDDGAQRARFPVLASALTRLGVSAPVVAELSADAEGVVQRGRGKPVGTVRATW